MTDMDLSEADTDLSEAGAGLSEVDAGLSQVCLRLMQVCLRQILTTWSVCTGATPETHRSCLCILLSSVNDEERSGTHQRRALHDGTREEGRTEKSKERRPCDGGQKGEREKEEGRTNGKEN